MEEYRVTISFTGERTMYIDADSAEEAVSKALSAIDTYDYGDLPALDYSIKSVKDEAGNTVLEEEVQA